MRDQRIVFNQSSTINIIRRITKNLFSSLFSSAAIFFLKYFLFYNNIFPVAD